MGRHLYLLCDQSFEIRRGHHAVAVSSVIVLIRDIDVAVFLVEVSDEDPSFVAHYHPKGVCLVGGEHHILGNTDYLHGDLDFLLVRLIQSQNQPEDARQDEEECEYQEFPARPIEQETLDIK